MAKQNKNSHIFEVHLLPSLEPGPQGIMFDETLEIRMEDSHGGKF